MSNMSKLCDKTYLFGKNSDDDDSEDETTPETVSDISPIRSSPITSHKRTKKMPESAKKEYNFKILKTEAPKIPIIKMEPQDETKISQIRGPGKRLLTLLWNCIYPKGQHNIHWSADGKKWIIESRSSFLMDVEFCKVFYDTEITSAEDLKEKMQKKLNALKRYFDPKIGKAEDKNDISYTFSPKESRGFIFEQSTKFGADIIVENDKSRKSELKGKSKDDLMNIILDQDQSIHENNEKLERLKNDLEDSESIHQVQLDSLRETIPKDSMGVNNNFEKMQSKKYHSKYNLEECIKSFGSLPFTAKTLDYITKDFSPLSTMTLDEWPEILEDWSMKISEVSNLNSKFPGRNHLPFRDTIMLQKLITYGKNRRKEFE